MPSRTGCCSYTVRAYDGDGATRWVADYFRDAITGEYDLLVSLSVAVIGDRVFVGGPRVAHVFGGGTTYWNLCVYDHSTGALIGKFDLWIAGVPRDGTHGNGDIFDICAGADGNLGVLFWQQQALLSHYQYVASYDPVTLATNWESYGGFAGQASQWSRIEMDAGGVAHMAGVDERARKAIKLDGTTEYQVGSRIESLLTIWWANTAFVAKSPGGNPSPSNLSLGNIYIAVDPLIGWPAHIIEEDGPIPADGRSNVWWTITTRGEFAATDSPSDVSDVAIMRDSGGAATNIVGVGAGFVRGATQFGLPSQGPPDPSSYSIQGTKGTLQDQGCVCVFSNSGTFLKSYSPVGLSSVGRIEAVPGEGYYLGAGSTPPGVARIMLRDASDAHLWAHRHQALSDLTVDAAGGVITVGERSRRGGGESDFITA